MTPQRIVVIRPGALGDVLLALPALRLLRERYPRARIEVVGYPALWQLAGSLADGATSIDRSMFAGLFAGPPSEELRAWMADTDLAVAWTTRDPSECLREVGARETVHAPPVPPPGVHAARWLLRSLGAPEMEMERLVSQAPSIFPGDVEEEAIPTEPAGPAVMIHPGAGAEWKRWPAPRFAAVARALVARGHTVALVEGPADREAVAEVQDRAGVPLSVIRDASLFQLAGALRRSRLFLGNDSGVTHLAAATGAPTVALFGPTDPASWAPPYPWVRVLRDCRFSPARQGAIRACDDPACMAAIDTETALAAVLGLPLAPNTPNGVPTLQVSDYR